MAQITLQTQDERRRKRKEKRREKKRKEEESGAPKAVASTFAPSMPYLVAWV
jgi:hypothetical protein